MSFSLQDGLAVARGIAIGQAVVVTNSRTEVRRYLLSLLSGVRAGPSVRRVMPWWPSCSTWCKTCQPIRHLNWVPYWKCTSCCCKMSCLWAAFRPWIIERLYNAEWALLTQLEQVARQFDEMEDDYRAQSGFAGGGRSVLRYMHGQELLQQPKGQLSPQASLADGADAPPLILVAQDLSPADMLQFKRSVFAGFVTSVGGKTSHTAIVARSMDIPAVVGARAAHQLIRQDDWLIVDGDAGVVLVDPSPAMIENTASASAKWRSSRLARLRHTPAITRDGD